MDDLAAFISARYDEAEVIARAAYGETGTWWRRERQIYRDHEPVPAGALYEGEPEVDDPERDIFLARVVVYDEGSPSDDEFAHIAACDPAHRLADIALKRAILASYVKTAAIVERAATMTGESAARDYLDGTRELCALEPVVRQLGTEFSGHADYKPTWKPEGSGG